MSDWLAALLGLAIGPGPVIALGVCMDRADERDHRCRMRDLQRRAGV